MTRPALSTSATASDEGAITLFAVVVAMALFLAVGLAVDGAGKVRAIQQADHAAAEAARAGGQQLVLASAVRGDAPTVDTVAAARAARSYLAAAGVTGQVRVSGTAIAVTAQATYDPVFVSLIGIGRMTVSGSATARPVRGIDAEVL